MNNLKYNTSNYVPRLSIDITEEQSKGLSVLEFGMRKQIFHLIIDDLLKLFEKHSPVLIIGAMLEKSIGVKEICKLKLKEKSNGDNK